MVTLETVNADVAVGGVEYQLNTTVSKDQSAGFHPAVFNAELFRGSFGPTRFALQAHEYGFAPAEGLGFSFADTPASNLPAPVADAHGATARIRTVGSAFASGVATFTSTSAPHVGRVQTCKAQGHVHSFRTYSYAGCGHLAGGHTAGRALRHRPGHGAAGGCRARPREVHELAQRRLGAPGAGR